jgi:hypothetical protein
MKIYRIAQDKISDIEIRYPKASSIVGGLEVLSDIPNLSSIRATMGKYNILNGVRVAKMDYFEITGKSYSASENKRISDLADRIKESGTISPLIVVVEEDGDYILEGVHRVDALFNLGMKEFPALVVINEDNSENI